jgi:hypothetical protein
MKMLLNQIKRLSFNPAKPASIKYKTIYNTAVRWGYVVNSLPAVMDNMRRECGLFAKTKSS